MISGLVVYLSSDLRLAEQALHAIRAEPTIELGSQQERRIPLVLEAASRQSSQAKTDWLIGLAGVEHVDVAFVHLDESQSEQSTTEPQFVSNKVNSSK